MRNRIDFFRWRDMYHLKRRQIREGGGNKHELRAETPFDFYNKYRRWFDTRNDAMSMMSCQAELDWFNHGKPYYKIWPAMTQALGSISIEIAGSYLHLPFPTYEVCLPKDPGLSEGPGMPKVCSLLVHKWDTETGGRYANTKDGRDYTLVVHYQFDTEVDCDWMGWYFAMGIKKDQTIEQQFDKTWERYSWKNHDQYEGYTPSKEFAKHVVTLAIATAFFGIHNHQMIIPDIPERFIDRYHRARRNNDKSEAEKLLDKAKKMGHFGWKIGSEIDLPLANVRHINEGDGGEPVREFNFGHIRSGHMRLQPYGPKDNPTHHELIFIAPTAVRPDLPIRETRGYRIRDDLVLPRN